MDGLLHGKSYLEMDDDWGTPILGNPHMWFDGDDCWFIYHGLWEFQSLLWKHGTCSLIKFTVKTRGDFIRTISNDQARSMAFYLENMRVLYQQKMEIDKNQKLWVARWCVWRPTGCQWEFQDISRHNGGTVQYMPKRCRGIPYNIALYRPYNGLNYIWYRYLS